MYILQIETATTVCSCAVSRNGKTLLVRELNEPNVHIEKLTLLIQELLEELKLSFQQIQAIAVSKGPGSYTGLRIGVSIAKGLCYALDIPLIAVSTLHAMTAGFLQQHRNVQADALLCPMIDARRREVYSAMYDQALNIRQPVAARIIDEFSFQSWEEQGQKILLFGEGADKFTDIFSQSCDIEIFTGFLNSADYLSEPAFALAGQRRFEDLAYFEPYYLKDFIPTTPKKKKGA